MPVLPNARHERFAQELAKGKSADEAYQAAGYLENRGNASRMKANENVAVRVAELQARGAIRTEITIESLTEMLREDRRLAHQHKQIAAAVSAAEKIGKLHGHFIDRSEVGKPGEFEGLNVDQKRERAVGLIKQLGIDNIGPVAGSA